MNWTKQDYQCMELALSLAKKGQYTARPNPMVGCVIVNQGQIVARGWHQKSAEAHAEINALKQAGEQARGATCYVTLEPCSHHGKTGPCAEALSNAGIFRVIAAMSDPNPQVCGKGFEMLQNAGIKTSSGLLQQQAEELNRGFIAKFKAKKPWVSLKLAMSLDGRTALADGSSQWITGTAARLDVQRLRARQDAIITGIGTLLADNPRLTVRGDGQEEWFAGLKKFEQPVRILLDRQGKASLKHHFFTGDGLIWWLTSSKKIFELVANGSQQSKIKVIEDGSIETLLRRCAKNGMNRVLIEAGHQLAGEFLRKKLVDEMIVYIAPKLMGNHAMGLVELNVEKMSNCPQLQLQSCRQFGDDLRLIYGYL